MTCGFAALTEAGSSSLGSLFGHPAFPVGTATTQITVLCGVDGNFLVSKAARSRLVDRVLRPTTTHHNYVGSNKQAIGYCCHLKIPWRDDCSRADFTIARVKTSRGQRFW